MAINANDLNPANFDYGFQVKQEPATCAIDQLTQTDVNITALVQESKKGIKTIKEEIDLPRYKEELYAGHVVKEELVIGPEILQHPSAAVSLKLTSKETWVDSTNKSRILSSVGERCKFLNGEPPYCCPVCNEEWKDKDTIIQHIQTHASDNSRCWVCEKTFTYKFSLKRHLLVHSKHKLSSVLKIYPKRVPIKGPPYNCSTCGKGFLMRDYLRRHKQRHIINDAGIKPYSCKVCEKKYSLQSELNKHIKTHDGNTFCCSYCHKTFTFKYSLVVHILRLHSTETPHSCGICGKRFKLRTALRHHIIGMHTKEYPYQCSICNKGFITNGCLKRHKEKHTDKR